MTPLMEAIRQARIELVNGIVSADPDAHIAAAVVAWMLEPATVEQMALAGAIAYEASPLMDLEGPMQDAMRAAIAALAEGVVK
jgi:hypothetical protein